MGYSAKKTVQKGALPLAIIIIAQAIIAIAKANNIAIDDTVVWSAATAGYGALVALFNWIKNRKKPAASTQPKVL